MKKVAFIYGGSSRKGGLDTYFKLLFNNYSKKEYDFRFVSLGKWATSQKVKDIGGNVYEIQNHRFSPIAFVKLLGYIKREKIDLIVTAGLLSNFYGRKVSLVNGIPVLTMIHSDFRYDYPGLFKKSFYYVSDRLFRFKTKHYIAVSDYLKKELIKSGVKKEKVTVVYNGIDFKDVVNERHEGVVIGSIGRLHKTKGFDVLIEAMKDLPSNVFLKIWGEGSERQNLENITRENGLSKRVKLEGFSEDILKSLSEIDIYVQPSRMEGFGLTVVEAMGASLPVIVSPNGALSELVNDGETGLLLNELNSKEIAEKINIFINDKELRSRLGLAAKKDVRKRFSIENWISGLEKVIGEVE